MTNITHPIVNAEEFLFHTSDVLLVNKGEEGNTMRELYPTTFQHQQTDHWTESL